MNRRESMRLMAGGLAFAGASGLLGRERAFAQGAAPSTHFQLPSLGYPYEALEPHIDAATMGYHHKNHHAAFIGVLNTTAAKWPGLTQKPIAEILKGLSSVPEDVRTPVRNAGGGHWNHSFFWELMTPGGPRAPSTEVQSAINGVFGDNDKMMAAVTQSAMGRFGSGWAWLVVGKDKRLAAMNTPYQDTPFMDVGVMPILGIDVWEHAYYLRYQYRRADYVKAWWNTVNWDKVAGNFKRAMG